MLFHIALTRLVRIGTLDVTYPDGTRRRYAGSPGPMAGMRIATPRALRRLTFNPALAMGEGYMDGEVLPEGCTLFDLLQLLVRNMRAGGSTS
jgi:cyclopropane-fatty-acyl-phospholipid synthase